MDREIVLEVSRDEVVSWLSEPVTKLVHQQLHELIKEAILSLGGGGVLDADRPENTAQNYAKMVGYIQGLRTAVNIEFDDPQMENRLDA